MMKGPHARGGEPKAVEPGEEAMAVEAVGKAPERLSEVELEYVAEMPPEIQLPNTDYAVDLFEAARQLGTQARYEKLRTKLSGVFRKEEEEIALRSVKSIPSIAHELGHAIDWRMNDNSFPSSIRKRFPGTKEKERDLRGELLRVSQIMRPVLNGPDAFSAYRRRHTEIMADFYSMYVLDPELAREYAPTIAQLFEARLRQKPNVAKVIADLMEARRRVPGEPEPDALAEAVRAQIGKLRPMKRLDLVVPEEITDYPEKVKWLVTMWSRLQTLKVMEAAKKAQGWQKELTEEEREDIGAAIEGVGNFRTGRTYDEIMETMTARQKEIMKQARYVQEVSREEVNKFLTASGQHEAIAFLEDYIFHVYAGPKKRKQEFITRWLKRSPSERRRRFLTYEDAMEAGLTPITQDIAYLYKMWSGVNWRMAINRSFIAELKNIRNEDGQPVIQKPKDAPWNWIRVDHPAIRQVYARRGKRGELHLWEGGAMVDPEAWRFLRQVFEQPINHNVMKYIEAFNAYAKKLSLTLSLFHPWALTESVVASIGRPWNLARGLVQFVRTGKGFKVAKPHLLGLAALEHEEFLRDCIASGLMVDPIPDVQVSRVQKGLRALEARTRKIFGINYFTQALRRSNEWWDNWLWHRMYTGMKAQTWNEMVLEALNQAPENISEQEIRKLKEKLAHLVNDAFGGQEWVTHWWCSPIARQLLHVMFLAPDWCVDAETRAMTKDGWKSCDELKIGDEIMIFDPRRGTLRWSNLKDKYINRHYVGPMVRVKTRNRSIMMTPDHTCYVWNFTKRQHEIVKAHELQTNHIIPRCAPFELPEEDGPFSDDFIRIAGWFVTDGYTKRSVQERADGTTTEYRYGRIVQAKPHTLEMLKTLGLPWIVDGRVEQGERSVNDRPMRNNYPKYTFNIPNETFRQMQAEGLESGLSWPFLSKLSRRQLELLYDRMMLGDGTGQNRFCGKERHSSGR